MTEQLSELREAAPLYDSEELAHIEHLKIALTCLDKAPTPESEALRSDMIDTIMNGGRMQDVFPDVPLSVATNRFLCLAMTAEVELAQSVVEQRKLQDNPAEFIARLTQELSEEDKHLAYRQFFAVRKMSNETSLDIFLRRLSGEERRSIAEDYNVTNEVIKDRSKRALKVWRGHNPDAMDVIADKLPKIYPTPRNSLATDLPLHLAAIDTELAQLSLRLNTRDFDYMTRSFVAADLSPAQMAAVLMCLNRSRVTARGELYGASFCDKARLKYAEHYDNFLRRFTIRAAERTEVPDTWPERPKPTPYEFTDEATTLIYQALGREVPVMPKETVLEKAKVVELGVYAGVVLGKYRENQSLPEDYDTAANKELRQVSGLGYLATIDLLAANIGLVKKVALGQKYLLGSEQDIEALMLTGMRGLLRGIRKFDHAKEISLSSYSYDWIRNFVKRDIFKNDWGVPIEVGEDILRMSATETYLAQQLMRQPTPQEVAEHMGIPAAREARLRSIQRRIRQPHSRIEGLPSADVVAATQDFRQQTIEALNRVFSYDSRRVELIRLRYVEHVDLEDAARKLDLSYNDARQLLTMSLSTLASTFTPDELKRLLGGV